MSVWYYDSHIHLSDSAYSNDLDVILSHMKHIQIKACCVSTNVEDSQQTISLAQKSDLVLPFVGIHPECVMNDTDGLESIITLVEKNKVSGIGEIGLDPTVIDNNITKSEGLKMQLDTFESLLSLAEKLGKPVSIHSRKSLDKVLDVMTSYDPSHALLHWFDGNKKQLRRAMDMGFYVSYGPVMIYANDKQSLLAKTHKSQILVETDGPVRFSRCFESKEGQISFIPSVIFAASKAIGVTFEEMSILLEENSERYLRV